MLQYALRRIVHTIPVLFGVLVVTFVLLYVAPGDPVRRWSQHPEEAGAVRVLPGGEIGIFAL